MTALRVKGAGSGEAAEPADDAEPGDAPWSQDNLLTAMLIDAVHENTWAVMQTQTEETIPRPDPIPRPGVRKAEKPQRAAPDPRLEEWLTRRQNGEDTTDLDAELGIDNVTPLRPMTRRGGGDGGHRGRSKP